MIARRVYVQNPHVVWSKRVIIFGILLAAAAILTAVFTDFHVNSVADNILFYSTCAGGVIALIGGLYWGSTLIKND